MSPSLDPQTLITHVTHQAMATGFVVLLPEHQKHRVETVLEALESLDEIEAKLTIYRASSEISRINQLASEQPVSVSRETFDLIEKSIDWSRRTGGAMDITAGPLVEAWGFTKREGKKPTPAQIKTALGRVGFEDLQLESDTRSVRFTKPDMSINLGAIGKGAALDRLSEHLLDAGINDFLIHGGHSSVIAHGAPNSQHDDDERGWAVGIAHPTKPKRRVAGVWLKDSALSTSGSGKQFFHHRGKRYGHVIDPRTGYPAGDSLSVTVIMPSAADADACSTGLFVCNRDEVTAIMNQPWAPRCIILDQGKRQDEVEIDVFGTIDWVDSPGESS